MSDLLLVEKVGRVLVLTINQPERLGALSRPIYTRITREVKTSGTDIGAIVITGNGRAFSAGGDVNEMNADAESSMREFQDMVKEIRRSSKPVIACVNGLAFGGGFSLAMACDLVIAAKQAIFCMAFSGVGLAPDGGIGWILTRLIGRQRTMLLAMTNERIDAAQAHDLGLVLRVEEDAASAFACAMELAGKLSVGPPNAQARAKHLLNRGEEVGLDDLLELEMLVQTRLLAGEEARSLRAAFKARARSKF